MTEFWRSTELPHLEARRSCRERSCYRPHAHDVFSIGLVEEGASVLAGPLGGPIRLLTGDVVVIPAGCVHACNPDGGRWRYRMMHVDQEWAASLAPEARAGGLFAGIGVLRAPAAGARLRALSETIFADAGREALEAGFAGMLRELAAVAPVRLLAGASEPELLERLGPALRRLRDDPVNPRLAELAESLGMSTYQFVRAMRRATGLAPLAWRQNVRMLRARRMLRAGRSIAETAYELGFADQSHFHRVFRAHVAASPGAYRR